MAAFSPLVLTEWERQGGGRHSPHFVPDLGLRCGRGRGQWLLSVSVCPSAWGALHWGIHSGRAGKQSRGDRAEHRVRLGCRTHLVSAVVAQEYHGPPGPLPASFLRRLAGSAKCSLQSLTSFEGRKAVTSSCCPVSTCPVPPMGTQKSRDLERHCTMNRSMTQQPFLKKQKIVFIAPWLYIRLKLMLNNYVTTVT